MFEFGSGALYGRIITDVIFGSDKAQRFLASSKPSLAVRLGPLYETFMNPELARKRIRAIKRSGLLDGSGKEQFGLSTELVRAMLDVPIAIISIVDEDRQVFAGHCGLPQPWATLGETPMTHSFCQHVVAGNAPLVVNDATLHDLVMQNEAIGELGVIAYLGVPIALPTGELVGALAAIDAKPRNWTTRDRKSLEALAKIVEKEIALAISELKYRSLFSDMQEGYYIASAIRDDHGGLKDVMFEEINPAFERLTGLSPEKVVGSSLLEVVPHVADDMLPAYARVLETGTVLLHANQTSVMGGRWFENRIRRLDEDRIASVFIDVTERVKAEERLRDSEAYWRSLFEKLEEGFILGEVIRDADNNIVDWRYKEVNRAWGELVGMPPHLVLGRTIRQVFPGIEDEWVFEFANVVNSGKPSVFTRQVGTIGRWYEGHAQPLGPDTFIVLFVEVTERLRLETELRDRERQLRTVLDSMPVGVALATAPEGRIIMQNETLMELIGQDATEAKSTDEYGIFSARYADGTKVKPENFPLARIMAGECRTDEMEVLFRRRDQSEIWISIVGEAIDDSNGGLAGAVVVLSDISERKRAEAQQDIINSEISHRLKNMLAMVQAIAQQTLKPVTDRVHVETFEKRLQALSSAHDVLLDQSRDEGSMFKIIAATLNRILPTERLDIDGPDIMVGQKGTLSLALLLHELATNAMKYGALSNEAGRVTIKWTVEGTGDVQMLRFHWRETDGPPVALPDRRGFGSKLIRMGLIGNGGVQLDYAPSGFVAEMTAPLTQLQNAE